MGGLLRSVCHWLLGQAQGCLGLIHQTLKILAPVGLKASGLAPAQEAGADGYFIKPFSPTTLITRVEEVLGRGQE